jgi:hypothetical protein
MALLHETMRQQLELSGEERPVQLKISRGAPESAPFSGRQTGGGWREPLSPYKIA